MGKPPKLRDAVAGRLTLSEWALEYIESRTLGPSTYRNYMRNLRIYIEPAIGKKYLDEIRVIDVTVWHTKLKAEARARARNSKRTNGDGSGEAAQVYKFLSGVFKGAVERGLARVVAGHCCCADGQAVSVDDIAEYFRGVASNLLATISNPDRDDDGGGERAFGLFR